jgi:hypothetical protein
LGSLLTGIDLSPASSVVLELPQLLCNPGIDLSPVPFCVSWLAPASGNQVQEYKFKKRPKAAHEKRQIDSPQKEAKRKRTEPTKRGKESTHKETLGV